MRSAVLLGLVLTASPTVRNVGYDELPAALQVVLTKQGISRGSFPAYIAGLKKHTADRVRAGEGEHFVYFALQSSRFTARPRIEPAVSARTYVESLDRKRIPTDADARLSDLGAALSKRPSDARLAYIAEYFGSRGRHDVLDELRKAYAAAMAFLYEKEFKSAGSEIYQKRGHSTDTQVEANFAVWTALATLQRLEPGLKLDRVLIVGPGLDFAPRTGLIDAFEPQSYQPFAIADALLQLKLTDPAAMSIECVDINGRVVGFLNEYGHGERKLNLVSGLRRDGLSSDFARYFADLGEGIGAASPIASLPRTWERHFTKSIQVRRAIAARVSAVMSNVIVERLDPGAQFDAVIVTNVFVYFEPIELALALANIHSMLKPRGYLLHNELRPEVEELGREVGLVPVQARTIQISAQGAASPLLDAFVVQQRR